MTLLHTQMSEALIQKSNVGQEEREVASRVTSCGVHSYNLSLHEELVDKEFTRELMGLVGAVKHT